MSEENDLEKLESKTPEELLLVGEACLNAGKFEDAIAVYKEIVKRDPRLPTLAKTCNDCGVAYASLKMNELAISFFNAALNLSDYLMDEGISTCINLGQIYKQMAEDEKAEEYFSRAKQLKREHKRREDEMKRAFSSVD
ncbi:MAG: tetratricopeptide repeat protein [Candidatus Methanospirareceae archaeon]